MSYRLEVTIPGLPQRVNQLYAKGWQKRMQARRRWKHIITCYVQHSLPPLPLNKARLTLTRGSSLRPDFDGLVSSFKVVIDALVSLNVLKDDCHEIIGAPTYLWEKAPGGKGFIKIIVEEI